MTAAGNAPRAPAQLPALNHTHCQHNDVSFRLPDLVLIPGLGADARLFEPQRAVFPHLRVPAWIKPATREPLQDYAVRLGTSANVTSESIIGGSSFGGMLALEIARAFHCRAAVLIGSCREPASVSPLLRLVEQCSRLLPASLLKWTMPLGTHVLPLLDPIDVDHSRLLIQMAEAVDPAFLKWGGRAVFDWPGCAAPGTPVFHIHGARDRIIPANRTTPDALVEGQGHFLNLSAADRVNAFLSNAVLTSPASR